MNKIEVLICKMAKQKHYIRGDGNGGWQVSNSIALLAIIVMVLLAIIPAVVANGIMQERVDNIENQVESCNNNYVVIDDKIDDIQERVVRIETTLDYIKDELQNK